MGRNWQAWHQAYDQPGSRLDRRLRVVQQRIREALDEMPPGPIRAISACAGEGRDLLGVLADHPRASDVTARLVELDPDLAALARERAPAGVGDIEVVCGDASTTAAYAGAVPANLVLLCGIFGNVRLPDIQHTIASLPTLCAPGATVVWTRHTRPPDATVDIRRWFIEAGFEEIAFVRSDEVFFGVGANRMTAAPRPWAPELQLFEFVGYDALLRGG